MSIHSNFQLSSHQVVSHPTSIVIPQIFHVTEEEKNKNQENKAGQLSKKCELTQLNSLNIDLNSIQFNSYPKKNIF